MSSKSRKAAVVRESSRALPAWKKALFALLACAVFLLIIEGLLAVFRVQPAPFERDPYVGFSGQFPLFVPERNSQGEQIFVTAKNKSRFFNHQEFPVNKAPNTCRIFCIGGSTTFGHPYTDSTAFSGWLRAMLPKADPSRRWEVINCGGISYASYREALLMEELIRYEPDLFIILTGHNEFLEQRTYSGLIQMPRALSGANALLSKTRTYAALKGGIDSLRKPTASPGASNLLSAEVDTILDRTVGPQAYHRDESLRKHVIDHFRFNLARMVDIARSAGAQIVMVTPAVNLRDCAPFKSEHRAGIFPQQLSEWQRLIADATQHRRNGNSPGAIAALESAIRIDGRYADDYFLLAHALWEAKRFPEARAAFLRALDEDVCPLRALPEMSEGMQQIAAQRQVALLDFVSLIESKSAHATPGDDWFLDHVHPTIEGHRVLALALIEKLDDLGVVRLSPDWNSAAQNEVKRAVESTLTPQDHGTALCTLAKVIAWAGKRPEAYRIALRARELAPNDAAVQFEVGKNAAHVGKKEEAITALRQSLALKPTFVEAKSLLGTLLMDLGQTNEALRFSREAAELRPTDAKLRLNLGRALFTANQFADGIAAYREALRLEPAYAEAHNNLGWALKQEGGYSEALKHFREAVRLRPGSTPALMGLAWLLATHPDPRLRDPQEARRISERLVELSGYENWMALDTFSAACAAQGRFPEAIQSQQKALQLVRTASPADAPAVQSRLTLYQQQQPFIEGP